MRGDPELFAEFQVAALLGMTRAKMLKEMQINEFDGWIAYLKVIGEKPADG